jgi:hypothetical protein
VTGLEVGGVNRQNAAFLAAGLAFGALIGFALFHAVGSQPDLQARAAMNSIDAPRGPQSPTQMGSSPGSGGGGPMVARINGLKARLEQDPQDVNALVELADLYQQAGLWAQAADYYERALAIEEDHPDLLTNLGLCYRGTGEYDRAFEVFDRAHRTHPGHWQSLFNKIIVAAEQGRTELALETLEALEAIEPRPPELSEDRLLLLRRAVEAVPEGDGRS